MTSASTVGSGGVSAAYAQGISNPRQAVALSPESLVALCAMQLQQFDANLLGRMNEKDSNMKLQDRISTVAAKLEGCEGGLSKLDFDKKKELIGELDSLITQLEGDSNRQTLLSTLQDARKKLVGEKIGDPAALDAVYREKAAARDAAFDKTGTSREDFQNLVANQYVDAEGNLGPLAGKLPDAQRAGVEAAAAERKAYIASNNASVGNGELSKADVTALKTEVASAGQALSSRNDAIMLELQTLVSQRSTAIQMTSNLTNSLLESTKTIAGNIGR